MRHRWLSAALAAVLALSGFGQEPAPATGGGEGQQEPPPKPEPAPEPVQEGEKPPPSEEPKVEAPRKDPQQEPLKERPVESAKETDPPKDDKQSSEVQRPPAPVTAAGATEGAATASAEEAEKNAAAQPPAATGPSHPVVLWPLTIDALELHLRGIAETHPEVASLEVLGHSAGGREILALRIGARANDASMEKPVLFLLDYQGPASAGAEALVELAWRLVSEAGRDERTQSLLERATLVVAPALDPDVRAASDGAPSAVRFERNFPSGWQPESVRPGSGRISLAKPETLAAARYLAGLKGCALVMGFVAPAPRGAPYAGAELPAADRDVFARVGAALELQGAPALVPWFELGSPGGGLFDFAYQARGIYPLLFSLPAEDELAAGGLAKFADQVATRVQRCLALLPRVEITQEGLERLASDTWQLDVRIQNVGIVPTSSALARREPLADVSLRLEGAKLVATAKKPSSGAAFTDASFQLRGPLSAGTLAGGEGRWLRLILEAGAGAEVRVTATSLWAGSDTLRVTLP